jgi:hypothetical protein
MQADFTAFLQDPTVESFLRVRSAILDHPKYDGYSDDLATMEKAFDTGFFASVRETFSESMPNLLLSPGAHMVLSLAARELGAENDYAIERMICFRCIDGIKCTGDGTRDRPYLVLRPSDEYDFLNAHGKLSHRQALIHDEVGQSFDHLECEDGTDYWFDVTEMFAALNRRFPDNESSK